MAKSLVVYHHYTDTVYLDGVLVIEKAGQYGLSVCQLCDLLGVKYEVRNVEWMDMPRTSRDVKPPQNLVDLESHFAALAETRRLGRIECLKAELARLEAVDPIPIMRGPGYGD